MKIQIDTSSFALGGLIVLLLGGAMAIRSDGIQFTDGTILTTADPRPSYFLTADNDYDGVLATGACGDGFHMASQFEILDPTSLRYAYDHPDALTLPDSGSGPPGYSFGWIRTGWDFSGEGTNFNSRGDGGIVNCYAYSSNSSQFRGTVAAFHLCGQEAEDCSNAQQRNIAPWWMTSDSKCSEYGRVWCVQD